jgi:phosphatidylserine/phosphatidylglycerophosphate/cardiolipin synthase-like enzyme
MHKTMEDGPIPFVQSGSYPMRSGNLVRPLIDGEPAFRRICQAIEVARKSVRVTVTFMWAAFEMPDGRDPPSMCWTWLLLAESMSGHRLAAGCRNRFDAGDHGGHGLAFALDPAGYGL